MGLFHSSPYAASARHPFALQREPGRGLLAAEEVAQAHGRGAPSPSRVAGPARAGLPVLGARSRSDPSTAWRDGVTGPSGALSRERETLAITTAK